MTQGNLENIEKFIAGQLPADEEKKFINEVNKNVKLRAELLQYCAARNTVHNWADERLKHQLKELGYQHFQNRKKTRRIKRFSLSAAAVLLIAIGITFLLNKSQQLTGEQIYLSHYSKPNMDEFASRATQNSAIWNKVNYFYDAGIYDSTLLYLEKLSNTNDIKNPSLVNFYYGICQMELENFEPAINHFNLVSEESSVYHEVQWYKTLAEIRTGDFHTGQLLITNMLEASNSKSKKLKKLQRDIKNVKEANE